MAGLTEVLEKSEHATLLIARCTQALGIALVDRLARDASSERPRLLGRVWRVQLDLAGTVWGEPVDVVDRTYGYVQSLTALHREFAHRLFEAVDIRELRAPGQRAGGNVIPFAARSGLAQRR